jgi:U3 small nucleolar RNA-associated protein 14
MINTCTCTPYEDCTYCLDNFYEEKKKVKRDRNKRRRQKRRQKEEVPEAAQQNQEYLILWTKQSGLKFETLKDLIGLNFN